MCAFWLNAHKIQYNLNAPQIFLTAFVLLLSRLSRPSLPSPSRTSHMNIARLSLTVHSRIFRNVHQTVDSSQNERVTEQKSKYGREKERESERQRRRRRKRERARMHRNKATNGMSRAWKYVILTCVLGEHCAHKCMFALLRSFAFNWYKFDRHSETLNEHEQQQQ